MTTDDKYKLIEQYVRLLNKRKAKMSQAFPCDDDMGFFVEDKEEMKKISQAKKALVKCDKELSTLMKQIRKTFSGFKDWQDVEIRFFLVVYSSIYSDLRFSSNDVVDLILNGRSDNLGLLNQSIHNGNLSHWLFREERLSRGFRYKFHSIGLAEAFLMEDN